MVMQVQDWALLWAGMIGGGVAVIHGVLTQKLMVAPVTAQTRLSPVIRRLTAALLQYSTFNWLLGGAALMLVAVTAVGPQAKLAVGLLVGSSYLFAVVGNFWGTRGRHPGWALYAVGLGLIVFGLWGNIA
ncbi:hypothetical protein [Phenylobacterium sp.]|uniref:hypothetical protein n=1 Tax=Phenylobacterium sp. TaxID=1871053 RepID=UPI003D2AFCDA